MFCVCLGEGISGQVFFLFLLLQQLTFSLRCLNSPDT